MKKVKLPKGFRELNLEDSKTPSVVDLEKFLKDIFKQESNPKDTILISISRYCKHNDKWITIRSGEFTHECNECIGDMFSDYVNKRKNDTTSEDT